MKRNHLAYRLTAFSLALLVFVTSVGWVLDMHYCAGELKSVSWLGKAKTCHEQAVAKPMKKCPHHQKMMQAQADGPSAKQKDCCENKTVYVHADQDVDVQPIEIFQDKQFQQFLFAYLSVFQSSHTVTSHDQAYYQYRPPLIARDIPVLVQSFLL